MSNTTGFQAMEGRENLSQPRGSIQSRELERSMEGLPVTRDAKFCMYLASSMDLSPRFSQKILILL